MSDVTPYILRNMAINVTVSGCGCLESVENLLTAETYTFDSDAFTLDTDVGVFSNLTANPTLVVNKIIR